MFCWTICVIQDPAMQPAMMTCNFFQDFYYNNLFLLLLQPRAHHTLLPQPWSTASELLQAPPPHHFLVPYRESVVSVILPFHVPHRESVVSVILHFLAIHRASVAAVQFLLSTSGTTTTTTMTMTTSWSNFPRSIEAGQTSCHTSRACQTGRAISCHILPNWTRLFSE